MPVTLLLLTALFLAAWLLRERAMGQERDKWTRERRELLNRIKPETAQYQTDTEPELFDHIPTDGPEADSLFWDDRERIA